MKKRSVILLLALCLLFLAPALSIRADAADLDEILRYEITVDVNDDATLRMVYHIDWMVLDSTSEGPLTWVEIGIPNRHFSSVRGRSAAVKKVAASGSSVRVDLDREYRAGEVVPIEFELVQDYMYQVDQYTDGETVYHFTPGWFDDIRVDEMVIRWNADKALGQDPECLTDKGYYTWRSPLDKGEHFSVAVTYPNDAFAFDLTKSEGGSSGDSDGSALLGLLVLLFLILIIVLIVKLASRAFSRTANFADGTGTRITRTKVEYYPVCQGCGATRPDGANNCEYCGRSFIKSEQIIKEEDIPPEEKELRKKTSDGLYRYSSSPNTYIRVHVTHVPVVRPVIHSASHSSSSHYSSSSSSSHHSSGRSSSSCAHSSCACACACACAGGGRAGCTTKDFYNTDLKLRQLALRPRRRIRP